MDIVVGKQDFLYLGAAIIRFMAMNTGFTPQFSLDELYISPVSAERYFDSVTGQALYRPVERNMSPTGIHLMDRFLQIVCLSEHYTVNTLRNKLGVEMREFSVFCLLLTGMEYESLHEAIRLRLADDLLRFTDMEMRDVARRCGYSDYSGLFKLFERKYKRSVGDRQRQLRKRGDVGRWRI